MPELWQPELEPHASQILMLLFDLGDVSNTHTCSCLLTSAYDESTITRASPVVRNNAIGLASCSQPVMTPGDEHVDEQELTIGKAVSPPVKLVSLR